jgi:sulfate/thiosulfate transport system substrate-binding protein
MRPKRSHRSTKRWLAGAAVLGIVAAACGTSNAGTGPSAAAANCEPAKTHPVTLAAYSTVYDVYGKLITAFSDKWKADTGKAPIFQTSFGGSTTQAQNVVNGFKADIVALSLLPDVKLIQDAGLITRDPSTDTDGSIVSTTSVVFDVRPGNPKGLNDRADLAKAGVEILTPDPAQSGGARWNILGAYGAATRGKVAGTTADATGASTLLTNIFKNVTVMDKSANDSLKNFESGNGDVAITYENQVLLAQAAGKDDTIVYPSSTILIQNPTVVVDKNAAEDCVTDVAKAFVDFLHTPDAQEIFASVGDFRPNDPTQAAAANGDMPALQDAFTPADLGGWDTIDTDVFGADGVFTKALAAAQG